ncbi:MAG: hypothetical protein CMH46_09015 [Muricauda sp.]|nr:MULTISPECIES: hypothetical protein [unclassified Allomuricauda]MAU15665.1 hypothetical protein [Allomuricauda sp.]
MGKKNELIFLIQSFEQPRILKIILDKSQIYDQIYVYGFTRKIHSVKNYKLLDEHQNINYEIVGTFEDGKYWNRLSDYLRLIWILYRKHGLAKKNLYVVGFDLRALSLFLFNKHVEYVISDLAWLYYPKPFKQIIGFLDKMLAKASDKVLMTSKGFFETYYSKYVKRENFVLTENKLATYGRVHPLEKVKSDKIHIAYVGAFRYAEIIDNLLNVVKNSPHLNLNFYGDGSSKITVKMKQYAQQYSNITFNGAFKNPDDLQKIYENNNVNFVVYDNRLENERVAMPNKFYESGFFNVPIICATGTYVGKRALELQMGWTCGIDEDSIQTFFENLDVEQVLECHERIKKLDKSMFNY